jgi:hypothetical protein
MPGKRKLEQGEEQQSEGVSDLDSGKAETTDKVCLSTGGTKEFST